MIVQLTNTNKKRNSTLQPTFSKSVNCVLKDGCSIINPVLIFDRDNISHIYNYVYISNFGRYYFVDDIVYQNAQIIYKCSVDALASFKTEIGASSYYVTRSASDSNGFIVDDLYPVTQEIEYENVNLTSFSPLDPNNFLWGSIAMYVVGVVAGGSIEYYKMNNYGFVDFFSYLLSDNYVNSVVGKFMNDVNENLKVLIDPLQYIASVYGYPFSTVSNNVNDKLSEVEVGFSKVVLQNVNSVVNKLDTLTRNVGVPISYSSGISPNDSNFPIVDHPQIARGAYMNGSKYSECTLITPLGSFPIDLVQLSQAGKRYFAFTVDLATGDALITLEVYRDGQYLQTEKTQLLNVTGKVGVPIPVSQIIAGGMNLLQGIGGVMGGVAGAITGNYVGAVSGFLGGTAGMIGQSVANSIPKARVSGVQGSVANLSRGLSVDFVFNIVADDDPTDHGKPLCEVKQLNTLSGFVLCEADKIEISGTESEAQKILDFLNGGFFYE